MNSRKNVFLLNTLILLAINPAFGESFTVNDRPIYQDGLLTIPLIDTVEQTGTFQDVTLRLTEQGEWRLLKFKMIGTAPLGLLSVQSVETIVTESFPFQVFLKVNGMFGDSCSVLGKISQRLTGNRFEVVMSDERLVEEPPPYVCSAVVTYFEKIIPLSVYGLSAGVYEYHVDGVKTFSGNGGRPPYATTFTGTFELARDNILSFDTN